VTRDWDATAYDRVSEPQLDWARTVLERLPLRGDETVLDAGCGSGRATMLLLERLPRGHVIAVDSAPSMVERAREALGDRATVLQADLSELTLPERVDAIFSNAVFHWVPDHDRLLERLFAVLEPGGRLIAQCGGAGNVADFLAASRAVSDEPPYAEQLAGWTGPWNFAGAEETAARLERAGFTEVETWLASSSVVPSDPPSFVRTVCLGPHLEQLPEDLHTSFVEEVLRRSGPRLDYVRLNIAARRPQP
jgi:trans-aconitate 2-methyltransferase